MFNDGSGSELTPQSSMSREEVPLSLLEQYSPLDGLKRENLKALARKASLEEHKAGHWLFQQSERIKRTIYLIKGEVELLNGDKRVRVIRGGSEEAKHPLAPVLPRRLSARTLSPCECLVIDSDLLDVMLTWDQTGSYEVSDLRGASAPETDDWMTALLQNKSFHRIPPANLQAVFMRMQRVTCKAGEAVIKQGQDGDYFYVITEGRCLVTRETPLSRDGGIKLAELRVGDSFGEEALISGAKRNATCHDDHGRRAHASRQGRLQQPAQRADAELGELRARAGDRCEGWLVARCAPAERVQPRSRRERDQHPAVLHPPQAEGAQQGNKVRRVLRHRPTQLGRGVHTERAWLRGFRPDGRAGKPRLTGDAAGAAEFSIDGFQGGRGCAAGQSVCVGRSPPSDPAR
jgi:CRP-like cAMP-binding protein